MAITEFKEFSLNNIIGETRRLVEKQLWAKIILFLILGLIVGYIIGPETELLKSNQSKMISEWLALPGHLFLILMQMIVIPLVTCSVILGIVNSESMEKLKKIAVVLFPYFVFTTAAAILIGFGVAEVLQPGKDMQLEMKTGQVISAETNSSANQPPTKKSLPATITSVLPSNPLGSMVEGNLFQIVIFSLLIGVALLSLQKEQALPIVSLLQSVQKTTMIIVNWAMYLAPFAVFGLMAELLSQVGFDVLYGIGSYAASVILALLGILIFYSIIVIFGARKNIFHFFNSAKSAQLLAFSTSSSAAVMPLTIETAEKKLGVSEDISRFVIPLGTTINMDGTAAYQGVAACFIAQAYGLDLSLSQILLIVVSATGASIGAPGTPGVGMAILASLLKSIGIPSDGILLIIGIDRLLDMCRTVINVTGDLTASLFFEHWIGGKK